MFQKNKKFTTKVLREHIESFIYNLRLVHTKSCVFCCCCCRFLKAASHVKINRKHIFQIFLYVWIIHKNCFLWDIVQNIRYCEKFLPCDFNMENMWTVFFTWTSISESSQSEIGHRLTLFRKPQRWRFSRLTPGRLKSPLAHRMSRCDLF